MGMTGIDGNFALLQIVRADQSVKWKKSTDNEQSEAAEAFAYRNMAFATLHA